MICVNLRSQAWSQVEKPPDFIVLFESGYPVRDLHRSCAGHHFPLADHSAPESLVSPVTCFPFGC
jgi:hypothetical protein